MSTLLLRSRRPRRATAAPRFRTILGIRFFAGALPALLRLTRQGGLIVVPSGPGLADLEREPEYRQAVETSDLALTDSGFLVLLWTLLRRERLPRISGLQFVRGLVGMPEFRDPGAVFWVMPTAEDAAANGAWLAAQGIAMAPDCVYLAPRYPGAGIQDPELVARIEAVRPRFVMLNIGGGVQERLGFHLRAHLSFRPAIICTGAAIAFLSGRQASIPPWADRLRLGWLLRCARNPTRFIPRYVRAIRLARVVWTYGEHRAIPHRPATGPHPA